MNEPSPQLNHSEVISINDASIDYGRKNVLREVSLVVNKGQVSALLGRNGEGKTSLIRCLLGHRKFSSGRASIFGMDCWRHRHKLMRRIGVVPEQPDAPPELTASQISSLCSGIYDRWEDNDLKKRLGHFRIPLDRAFGSLSKGQKGQLMLSLALAPRPELLILDDPTLGLDVVARNELLEEMICELADRGTTVLIASHDLSGIEGIADRIAIIDGRKIVIDETIETLKSTYRRIRFDQRDGNIDFFRQHQGVDFRIVSSHRDSWGLQAVIADFSESCEARLRAGIADLEFLPISLEEIFAATINAKKEGVS